MSIRIRVLKWPTIALLLVLCVLVARRTLYLVELRRVAKQLGYTGPPNRFPIAHFRRVAPIGARPATVWHGMTGYDTVAYYIAPVVGTADSVVIQRYRYPLRVGALHVDILYLGGVVHDVEVDDQAVPGTSLEVGVAYARMGWRPGER